MGWHLLNTRLASLHWRTPRRTLMPPSPPQRRYSRSSDKPVRRFSRFLKTRPLPPGGQRSLITVSVTLLAVNARVGSAGALRSATGGFALVDVPGPFGEQK